MDILTKSVAFSVAQIEAMLARGFVWETKWNICSVLVLDCYDRLVVCIGALRTTEIMFLHK
jgi:hypothetical protein